MNWKDQLRLLESKNKWQEQVAVLLGEVDQNPNNVEATIRLLYLLHNLLIEEDYTLYGFDHDSLANLLLVYFQNARKQFDNDTEFLFFMGIILHIAEWYFGQNDVSLALQMQKKALDLDPDNSLYRFSYEFSKGNKEVSKALAKELLSDVDCVKWLQSKGFPGIYALQIIENANQ